ncbi:MAG TPA: helix-turn-helix transcriptional regulator, partial [Bryobacteraceae bacterium]
YATVAFQVSAIREQRSWSQKQLGRIVNMAQERISILEDPNAETKPTLTTLLRLAAGFDCGLDVRFVPYSRVLNNSFNNGPEALRVPSFEDEAMEIEDVGRLAMLIERTGALESASGDNRRLVSIDSSVQFGSGTIVPNSTARMPVASETRRIRTMDDARSGSQ